SVTPKQFDLSVLAGDINFSPSYPYQNQIFSVTAKISNEGQIHSGSFTANVYRYVGNDSLLLSSVNSTGLDSGHFIIITTFDTAITQTQQIFVRISYPPDEKPQNNFAFKQLVFGTKRFSVVVNEINYLPSPMSTEWLELYNRSQDSVNLKKWKWSDEANFYSPKTITYSDYWLKPGEYMVIAKDSSLFNNFNVNVSGKNFYMNSNFSSLNNSGDLIVLIDSLGITVDSLFYEASWGGGLDISMERVFADSASTNPLNWASSEALRMATPGSLNSQTPVPFDIAIQKNDIVFTPPHPAINQPVAITIIVRNKGLQNISSSVGIKVFYDADASQTGEQSELIDSTAINNLDVGDSHTVVVNWIIPPVLSKRNSIFAESRYIIVQLEYDGDQRIENNISIQEIKTGIRSQSVLINEIVYEPDTSQVEFIEIYNMSNAGLNLQNWLIADASSSKVITEFPHYVPSLQFRVLTGDSVFFSKYPNVPDSLVIIVPALPSLNNTDDKVILKDDVGNVVDSLHYYNTWGGRNGKSLERRSYSLNTNDPANWVSCLSANRATPGFINSILQAHAYSRNTLRINEIMYSPFSGEPEYVEIYNPADSGINLLNWSLQVGDDKTIILTDPFILASKDYVVLAQSTSFSNRFDIPSSKILLTESGLPTLSNSGNTILLQDLVGNTIDSVNYSPAWGGGEGISIERIRSDGDANESGNWGSCVFIEGGTPGAVNSNIAGNLRKKIKISASPNPFLVDQGEQTKITIEIPVTQARMTVKIYDNRGRLIITLLNNSLSGSHREIEWDGKDKGRSMARMGIYIIYVEVIDELSGFNKSAKQTVVLGRKL
ncbi:lamin tail domain-containing protein, partial [bacterium]|nr:lamin tail domain-containing protein [bacterium]